MISIPSPPPGWVTGTNGLGWLGGRLGLLLPPFFERRGPPSLWAFSSFLWHCFRYQTGLCRLLCSWLKGFYTCRFLDLHCLPARLGRPFQICGCDGLSQAGPLRSRRFFASATITSGKIR